MPCRTVTPGGRFGREPGAAASSGGWFVRAAFVLALALLGACRPAEEPSTPPVPSEAKADERAPGIHAGPEEPAPAPPALAVTLPAPAPPGGPAEVGEDDGAPIRAGDAARWAKADLVQYELRLERSAYQRLTRSPFSNETCPAVFLAGDQSFEGARVRYRGQWARSWPKKPLKIFLPSGRPYHGYGALNLNSAWRDPAFIREVMAYHVYAACGAPSPRARMARLRVNGQFEGLYVDVEQPKRQYLERLGLAGAGVYKALGNSNTSDERDLGSLAAYAAEYEKETRESEGFTELQRFCRGLATATNVPAFFERHVDIEKLINYLAAGVLVQNWDCYNKNHHLIHDVAGSGKWFPTPWDVDRTFGDHWDWSFDTVDLPVLLGTRDQPGVTGWNRLADAFLRVPAYRVRFLDRLEALTQTEFTSEKLFPVIDRWYAAIAADAAADRARWRGPAGNLGAGIAQLKAFVEQRRAFVRREVAELRRSTPGGGATRAPR